MDNNDTTGWLPPSLTPVSGLESMRVMQIAAFLPEHERDALFDTACANQEAFRCPDNPGSDGRGSLYLPLKSDEPNQQGVGPVRNACECLSARIHEFLPTMFGPLGVESFPVPSIPLTLLNGLNGHCGVPHTDESGGRFKISLLYYFHSVPKAFRGGDLEFFKADSTSSSGHAAQPLSRIEHEDNLLIAFPSHTFHGITNVQCESDNFADGDSRPSDFWGRNRWSALSPES